MQTSAAQIAKESPPPLIIWNICIHLFFGIIFQFYFYFFLIEAAQYECSYRRTAHHATAGHKEKLIKHTLRWLNLCYCHIAALSTAPRATTSLEYHESSKVWSRIRRSSVRIRGTTPNAASCRSLRTWQNTCWWWRTVSCKNVFSFSKPVNVSIMVYVHG